MRKITRFLRETYTELRKVVWPTRRRTARLTVIVAVITVVTSAFLASVDFGLDKGIQYVIDNTQQPGDAGQPAPGGQPGIQTLPGTAPDAAQPQSVPQVPTQ